MCGIQHESALNLYEKERFFKRFATDKIHNVIHTINCIAIKFVTVVNIIHNNIVSYAQTSWGYIPLLNEGFNNISTLYITFVDKVVNDISLVKLFLNDHI